MGAWFVDDCTNVQKYIIDPYCILTALEMFFYNSLNMLNVTDQSKVLQIRIVVPKLPQVELPCNQHDFECLVMAYRLNGLGVCIIMDILHFFEVGICSREKRMKETRG